MAFDNQEKELMKHHGNKCRNANVIVRITLMTVVPTDKGNF